MPGKHSLSTRKTRPAHLRSPHLAGLSRAFLAGTGLAAAMPSAAPTRMQATRNCCRAKTIGKAIGFQSLASDRLITHDPPGLIQRAARPRCLLADACERRHFFGHDDPVFHAADLLRDTLQDLRPTPDLFGHRLLAEVPVRCGALGRDIFKIISPERGLRGLVKIPDMIQPRPVTPAGVLQAHANRMLDPGLKRRLDKVRGSDVRNRLSSRVAVHRLHFIARHGKD